VKLSPLALSVLVALPLTACGDRGASADAGPVVAYVTNGTARFWTIGANGAMAGAEEFGVECDVRMPDGAVEQKRILEDLVTRGVAGIAVSPIDPRNQVDLINDICSQTRVITQDSDAPGTDRLCFIGPDNYEAGRSVGKMVMDSMPDGGSVFIFVGRLEQDNARHRRQGVIDELMGWSRDPERYSPPGAELDSGKYQVLGTRTDQFNRAKAKSNAEDALTRFPDLGCMVGLFEYNPPACLEALRGEGKLGQVKVVAFDEADATLQGILDGHVVGTVVQDPFAYGRESVRILAGLARGDTSVLPDGGVLDIPTRVIRADNVDDFWADLKVKLNR